MRFICCARALAIGPSIATGGSPLSYDQMLSITLGCCLRRTFFLKSGLWTTANKITQSIHTTLVYSSYFNNQCHNKIQCNKTDFISLAADISIIDITHSLTSYGNHSPNEWHTLWSSLIWTMLLFSPCIPNYRVKFTIIYPIANK